MTAALTLKRRVRDWMKYSFDRRQLLSLVFVSSLAPAIRLLPKYNAQVAGSAGWISPLIALPILILYVLLLSAFMSERKCGEGLGELILRTNGRVFGSVVLSLSAAFLIFCCGFILRSGAERFICTVYPASGPWLFVAVMLALGTIAALGPIKALLRSARIFSPVLVAVLLLVLVFATTDVDPNNLLPLHKVAPAKMIMAAFPVVEIYAGMLAYAAFLEGHSERKRGRAAAYSIWLVPVCLLLTVLCAATIGSYGAALTERFSYPFFTMIRNITLFGTIERVEAIVVALWVLPDFIIFAMMLTVAAHSLRLVLGFVPERCEVPLVNIKNGRWLIPACAALCLGVSILLDLDSQRLNIYSEVAVPLANSAVSLVLIPLCFVVSKLKTHRSV